MFLSKFSFTVLYIEGNRKNEKKNFLNGRAIKAILPSHLEPSELRKKIFFFFYFFLIGRTLPPTSPLNGIVIKKIYIFFFRLPKCWRNKNIIIYINIYENKHLDFELKEHTCLWTKWTHLVFELNEHPPSLWTKWTHIVFETKWTHLVFELNEHT